MSNLKRVVRLLTESAHIPEAPRAEILHLLSQMDDPYGRAAYEAVYERKALQKPIELRQFLELVAELRPRLIAEIGSADGGTLFAWHTAFPEAELISLDVYVGLPNLYGATAVTGDTQQGSTWDRLEQVLDGRRLDFLFIDGDHRYEAVKSDFFLYRDFVRPGGVIGLHDINTLGLGDIGVWQFWAELKVTLGSRCEEILDEPYDRVAGIGVVRV